jgi:hypothetical protein
LDNKLRDHGLSESRRLQNLFENQHLESLGTKPGLKGFEF